MADFCRSGKMECFAFPARAVHDKHLKLEDLGALAKIYEALSRNEHHSINGIPKSCLSRLVARDYLLVAKERNIDGTFAPSTYTINQDTWWNRHG